MLLFPVDINIEFGSETFFYNIIPIRHLIALKTVSIHNIIWSKKLKTLVPISEDFGFQAPSRLSEAHNDQERCACDTSCVTARHPHNAVTVLRHSHCHCCHTPRIVLWIYAWKPYSIVYKIYTWMVVYEIHQIHYITGLYYKVYDCYILIYQR